MVVVDDTAFVLAEFQDRRERMDGGEVRRPTGA